MILHADADAFFAGVEARDDPSLRGRAFVVADWVITCASYEARALGIRSGIPVAPVLREHPGLLVVPPRMAAYAWSSAELLALFRRWAVVVEPGSMEEAFLEPGPVRDVAEHARELRRAAREELGLAVSVGVARTKLFAKLASRRAKPDGLVVVDAATEARVRPRLVLADLWGVGGTTARRLTAAGLHTVADLDGLDEAGLKPVVGTAMARRLLAVAAGTEDAVVTAPGPPRSFGAQRKLPATRSRTRVEAVVTAAAASVGARLRNSESAPRGVTLVLTLDDGVDLQHTAELTDADRLEAVVADLLARSTFDDDGRGVRVVGVRVDLVQGAGARAGEGAPTS